MMLRAVSGAQGSRRLEEMGLPRGEYLDAGEYLVAVLPADSDKVSHVHNVLDHTMNRLCDVAAWLHPTHTYSVWSGGSQAEEHSRM